MNDYSVGHNRRRENGRGNDHCQGAGLDELKPEMMQHLIREHEKLGRTLTEEETVTLLRSVGFEIIEGK